MSRAAEAVDASDAERITPASERIAPAQKIALVAEVLRTYGRARRTLSRSDLPTTLEALRRGAPEPSDFSPATHHTGKQLGGAVQRTLALHPPRSRCLMQSLTLTAMLARRGIDSSLVIGVKSGEDPDEDFGAHAWVEYHGRPLLPVLKRRFERLTEV